MSRENEQHIHHYHHHDECVMARLDNLVGLNQVLVQRGERLVGLILKLTAAVNKENSAEILAIANSINVESKALEDATKSAAAETKP